MRRDVSLGDLTNPVELIKLKGLIQELYTRIDTLDPRTNDPSGDELYEGRIWIRTDL